jgi:hypothetical protein
VIEAKRCIPVEGEDGHPEGIELWFLAFEAPIRYIQNHCGERLRNVGGMNRNRSYSAWVSNGEPKTAGQWIPYIVMAVMALVLVWTMLRVYVL